MTSPKIKWIIPFALLFLLIALLWNELSSTRSTAYSSGIVGEKLPAFNVKSLYQTKNISNDQIRGHVALVHFWASWCAACSDEHDMLMKIKNTYHVPIIGIAFKDQPDDARDALATNGNPFEQAGYDLDGEVGVDFGIYATPETFVVNPAGDIVYKHIGMIDQTTWDNTIYPLIKKLQT